MTTAIKRIVIHCSATSPGVDIGAGEIDRWHRQRGFRKIGYTEVIRRNGVVEAGRAEGEILAHAKGFNRNSIAICLVGGVDLNGKPEINFTEAQRATLKARVDYYTAKYPDAKVIGHRDLTGVLKDCPCFDVPHWLETGEMIDPYKKV